MTVMAIMLGLLVGPKVAVAVAAGLTGRRLLDGRTAGCLGAALLFLFAGVGHFLITEPMARMLPPWVPGRTAIVYASGVVEIVVALAVLVPRWRAAAGWTLVGMPILFLPVNVYAAIQRVPIGGHEWGLAYLLIRVPLQLVLAAWIWWHAVRRPAISRSA